MSDRNPDGLPPLANGDSATYWLRLQQGKLVFQKCTACGQVQHPPRHLCRHCWSDQLTEVESQGAGEVESVTTVRRAPIAEFRNSVPYVIASIRMAEGPRVIATLLGERAQQAVIGDPVRLEIHADRDGNPLPCFRHA